MVIQSIQVDVKSGLEAVHNKKRRKMDKEIQFFVKKSINEHKEEVICGFQVLFQYPFHPDATLLEVRGDTGSFGISVTQMNGWGKSVQKNAYGENVDLEGFVFDAYAIIEQDYNEIINDLDLAADIDDYAKEYFVPFFQEYFNLAGGKKKAKLPFYLYYPNSMNAYDLVKEKWLDEEEYL
ncbi:hypothetical protein [Thermoactinomyces mirandus]|uniref:Uncharacterized protein n=1 Tax=Thermoactinomyces mirandus TaxID=2756294 RepID=A0A7W2AQI2_9BACL|nr:hypothetical protein [Thermoactinomyces mirandus]MBA4601538.1 hypothetical protein [Thermoactinomyces mirandus]